MSGGRKHQDSIVNAIGNLGWTLNPGYKMTHAAVVRWASSAQRGGGVSLRPFVMWD